VAFMKKVWQDIETHIGDDQAGHDTTVYFPLSVVVRACLLQLESELLGRSGGRG
jgi:hypothetical protein